MENADCFLVKRLAEGDERAFVTLYHKYHRRVYYSALKMTQQEVLAQDITQNVFLKIWDTRCGLDPNQNFGAYVNTVCRNAIFDLFRAAVQEERIRKELRQFAEVTETENEDDFYEIYKPLLDKAIASLPPQRRVVFECCKLQEKSYEEVARALGIQRSTVQDHMVKANKFIREYLLRAGGVSFVMLFAVMSHIQG
jgi:RNA polymerase sigma-70 factor (ECF subfamily)